ncbi:MAG TPA: hypothetical protein VNC61_01850 [Acidimicrobiales bacterium]|nr:hypothetical protein [Acidimicrobiales bacterium]
MARQGIMDTEMTTEGEEDIEAELFFSTREMGVACFVFPELDEES